MRERIVIRLRIKLFKNTGVIAVEAHALGKRTSASVGYTDVYRYINPAINSGVFGGRKGPSAAPPTRLCMCTITAIIVIITVKETSHRM